MNVGYNCSFTNCFYEYFMVVNMVFFDGFEMKRILTYSRYGLM